MSTFKVSVVRVSDIINHPNADRLDLVRMEGMDWQVVTAKGNFKVGDLAVYFPIDSILPNSIETVIFGPDSKVKLNNSRVRTIKLRGAISQGLIVKYDTLGFRSVYFGDDLTKLLGVTKYEPPIKQVPGLAGKSTYKQSNPNFRKYTGIENAKNYNNVFTEGEMVHVTEKLHGTNFRAGYVEYYADTLWKKVKKFLRLAPKYEFVYGSHNVQLQSKLFYKGYYDRNIYAETVVKYDLVNKLKRGEVVYGEIIGDGVQKGYTYGCNKNERRLVLFDLLKDDKFVNTEEFKAWALVRDFEVVPVVYIGPFKKEKIMELRDGVSLYNTSQKVREGIVVKPIKEEQSFIGRKILKFISDEYLLKNQDDETLAH